MKTLLPLMLTLPLLAQAQDTPEPAPPPPPPKPCSSDQHRQFDFWVGDWEVTQNGQPAGHNTIAPIHNGCALSESWTAASGTFTGSSLNIYDQATDRWHQTWVDSVGTLLELNGGVENGAMVMSGERPDAQGNVLSQRITWTPNEDGSVRQHWEVKPPGGEWSTAFDGLYRKSTATE